MSDTPLVISSGGLNPSNHGDCFPNLARGSNPSAEVIVEVTAITKAELEADGIAVGRP